MDLLATTRFEWSYYTIKMSLDIFYNLEMKIQIYFQLPIKHDCKMPRFSVFLKYITNDCKTLRFSVFLKHIRQIAGGLQNWVGNSNISFHLGNGMFDWLDSPNSDTWFFIVLKFSFHHFPKMLTLSWRGYILYRNQSICRVSQWISFYMIRTSVMKELSGRPGKWRELVRPQSN